MKSLTLLFSLLSFACLSEGATHYVDITSSTSASPYSDWSTAATNIQDAVDAATAGELIVVSNGVYQTGGRVVYGILSNRVAVTKPLFIQSVNGPDVTVIRGYQVPGSTNGDSAIRCVYLTNGALLAGFTLTNGATRTAGDNEFGGGGVWCESTAATISNCVLVGNSAVSAGGARYGTLINCLLATNTADQGGATLWSTLINCALLGNRATYEGGGAEFGTLNGCTLVGNSGSMFTTSFGGGADGARLTNCTLVANSATEGGGGWGCLMANCTLATNSAYGDGGGAARGTLIDCTLISNHSALYGGGAYYASMVNCLVISNSADQGGGVAMGQGVISCTIAGNTAASQGGGLWFSSATNSIVYYNTAPNGPNYSGNVTKLYFCCTTPQTTNGFGNIVVAPLFMDQSSGNWRLQSNSSCINAGYNAYAASVPDLDGNSRIVAYTVDIGAYEFSTPSSVISYAWLKQFGFPTDGSADFSDPDGDQMNNWQEWIAGTNPQNATSALRLSIPVKASSNVLVTWQSVTNKTYFLERSTNFGQMTFNVLATNIPGRTGATSYTDTNASMGGPYFYRVGVRF
jgi:hypothetical protein